MCMEGGIGGGPPALDSVLAAGVWSLPVVGYARRRTPTPMWSTIEAKVRRGERLSVAEGVHLLSDAPLLELGSLAHEVRAAKTDPRLVTYVIDTNPNYTNACTVDCHFCAFYRKPGHAEVYTY